MPNATTSGIVAAVSVARLVAALSFAALAFLVLAPDGAQAQFRLDPASPGESVLGPQAAQGVVIWSHGRSVSSEDSLSPTPSYIAVLHQAGWDTFRFNRMRDSDTLPDSTREPVMSEMVCAGRVPPAGNLAPCPTRSARPCSRARSTCCST